MLSSSRFLRVLTSQITRFGTSRNDRHRQEVLAADAQDTKDNLKIQLERYAAEVNELKADLKQTQRNAADLGRDNDDLASQLTSTRHERKDLQARCSEVVEELEEANGRYHEARKLLEMEQGENQKLRTQVTKFKTIISTSSQMATEVADDVIRAEFEAVFFSIQDFVVKTFRGVRFGEWLAGCCEPRVNVMSYLLKHV